VAEPTLRYLKYAVGLCAALILGGCAGPGKYVWFKDLPKAAGQGTSAEYQIGVGDSLSVRVYEQEGLSLSVKVRKDGRIALPLVGEIIVAGKAPLAVARELEGRFKEFVVSPRVTVNVEQTQAIQITAIGEVGRVGPITLEPPAQLIQAMAQAGGPNDYGDKDRIFVVRQFPSFQRIRFSYDDILRNEGGAAAFPLLTGDVIVIE